MPEGLRLSEVPVPLAEGGDRSDAAAPTARRLEVLKTLDLSSATLAHDAAEHGFTHCSTIDLFTAPAAVPPPPGDARVPLVEREGLPGPTIPLRALFADVSAAAGNLRAQALYDASAERFLVLAVETVRPAPTDHVPLQLLLAVSDDPTPEGAWYVTALDVARGARQPASSNWAVAIDEEAVYLIEQSPADTSTARSPNTSTKRTIWAIEKGEQTLGLYAGGAAAVTRS